VSTLAERVRLDSPPKRWIDRAGDYSDTLKTFLWNGLAPNTRQTYNTAIKSYETFCKTHGKEPFPAQRDTLGEWVIIRAIGSP